MMEHERRNAGFRVHHETFGQLHADPEKESGQVSSLCVFPRTTTASRLTRLCASVVHSVFTIGRVAKDLGEDEDWLWDVANGMDPEDGVIWVYGIGDDGVMAFTDFGIENLMELIGIHKETPNSSGGGIGDPLSAA